MKKMICMLLMAIVCLQLADAQNPGYLGKHFFVNVDGVISPSRNNPTWVSEKMVAKGADMYDKKTSLICRYLGFNYLVSPSVEYVAWKKGSIGVGYNFFQSAFSRPVILEFFEDEILDWLKSNKYTPAGEIISDARSYCKANPL